jgi:hypothetical protein
MAVQPPKQTWLYVLIVILSITMVTGVVLLGIAISTRYATETPQTTKILGESFPEGCPTWVPTPRPTAACPADPGLTTPTPIATVPVTVTVEPTGTPASTLLCWDPRLTALGITVERRNGEYELVAAWLTKNGNWGVPNDGDRDDVPDCARQWQSDVLGGDHMAFGRLEQSNGAAMGGKKFYMVWSYPTYQYGDFRYQETSGWANLILAGQNWTPSETQGPYTVFFESGDKLNGLGMPNNQHYSFFGVWRPKIPVTPLNMIGIWDY